MSKETPMPMPVSMRGTVNFTLGDRQMIALDDNQRFIVRRLVADAYAVGFQDGRWDAADSVRVDRQANADREAQLAKETPNEH